LAKVLVHEAREERFAFAVERCGRLVEQPERPRGEDEPRQTGAPPLAGREHADGKVERMAEPDGTAGFVEVRVERHPPLLPVERRPEAQRLAQRQRRLQRVGMTEIVDDRLILGASLVLGRMALGGAGGSGWYTPRIERADLWAYILGSFLLATLVAATGSALTFVLAKGYRRIRRRA